MNEQINTKQNQDPGTSNIGSPDITPGLSMSALAVAAKGVGLGGTKNLGLNPRNGANTQTPVDVAPKHSQPSTLERGGRRRHRYTDTYPAWARSPTTPSFDSPQLTQSTRLLLEKILAW